MATLGAKIATVSGRINAAKSFLDAANKVDVSLPAKVQAELLAKESLETTVAAPKDQILQAEQADNGASVDLLQGSLRRNRSALAQIDKSLQGHYGNLDETITSYIARLRFLQMEIFHLDEQLIAARSTRSVADEALRQTTGRRAAFDAELPALQEELEDLDFDLQLVDVSAAGEHVFSAQVGGPYLELQQVNAALAALGPVLDKLQLARNAARGDFL